MSTMGGGGGSPEFEKLIQLATFVQGEGYLARVKELQALEASSKEAFDKAQAAIEEANAAHDKLDKREAAVKQKEDALARDREAHQRRVSALSEGIRKAST